MCFLGHFSAGVAHKIRSDFELTCDGPGSVSDSDGPKTKGLMLTSSDLFYLRPSKGETNVVILPPVDKGKLSDYFSETFSPYVLRCIV